MRREFVLVLLVVTCIWQFIAIGGRAGMLGQLQDTKHTMLHWTGEAHHHHADGSLGHDGSGESVSHLLADYVLSAPVALQSLFTFLPEATVSRPLVADEIPKPSPDLPGLKRPPRDRA